MKDKRESKRRREEGQGGRVGGEGRKDKEGD